MVNIYLPRTNPMATHACKDWTRGLEVSGPNIVFINPLSATSNDPVPKVKSPNTSLEKFQSKQTAD